MGGAGDPKDNRRRAPPAARRGGCAPQGREPGPPVVVSEGRSGPHFLCAARQRRGKGEPGQSGSQSSRTCRWRALLPTLLILARRRTKKVQSSLESGAPTLLCGWKASPSRKGAPRLAASSLPTVLGASTGKTRGTSASGTHCHVSWCTQYRHHDSAVEARLTTRRRPKQLLCVIPCKIRRNDAVRTSSRIH